MHDALGFKLVSTDERVDYHKLYLNDGVQADAEFIADLMGLSLIELALNVKDLDDARFVALYLRRPCYAVELVPTVTPLVGRLTARVTAN